MLVAQLVQQAIEQVDAASLVSVPASGCAGSGLLRVAPRDPDASLLVQKLEHTQRCGAPMPNAGTRLPQTLLQRVRAWILAGAARD